MTERKKLRGYTVNPILMDVNGPEDGLYSRPAVIGKTEMAVFAQNDMIQQRDTEDAHRVSKAQHNTRKVPTDGHWRYCCHKCIERDRCGVGVDCGCGSDQPPEHPNNRAKHAASKTWASGDWIPLRFGINRDYFFVPSFGFPSVSSGRWSSRRTTLSLQLVSYCGWLQPSVPPRTT